MPRYKNFKLSGTGVVLESSEGFLFCPSKYDAEQKLLHSIHSWAGVNINQSRKEMEILTALIRAV